MPTCRGSRKLVLDFFFAVVGPFASVSSRLCVMQAALSIGGAAPSGLLPPPPDVLPVKKGVKFAGATSPGSIEVALLFQFKILPC